MLTDKSPSVRTCNDRSNRRSRCTIATGKIIWKRIYAGNVSCTAATDDVLTVYWIKPGMYLQEWLQSGSTFSKWQ